MKAPSEGLHGETAVFGPGSEWDRLLQTSSSNAVTLTDHLISYLKHASGSEQANSASVAVLFTETPEDGTNRTVSGTEYTGLVTAICKLLEMGKGPAQAYRLIQTMEELLPGLLPTTVAQMKSRVAAKYCKRGQPDKAMQLVDDIIGDGLSPGIELWGSLISLYSKNRLPGQAEEVFSIMMRELDGSLSNSQTVILSAAVSTLVAELSRQKQTQRVREVVFEASTRSIEVYPWANKAFVYCLASTEHWDEAKELWDRVSNTKMNNWTCAASIGMAKVYMHDGDQGKAVEMLCRAHEAQTQYPNFAGKGLLHTALKDLESRGVHLPKVLQEYLVGARTKKANDPPKKIVVASASQPEALPRKPGFGTGSRPMAPSRSPLLAQLTPLERLKTTLGILSRKRLLQKEFFLGVDEAVSAFDASASEQDNLTGENARELVSSSVERYLESLKKVDPRVRQDAFLAADRVLKKMGCEKSVMEDSTKVTKSLRALAEQGNLEEFISVATKAFDTDYVVSPEALSFMAQPFVDSFNLDALIRLGQACSGERIAHRYPRVEFFSSVVQTWITSGHTEEAALLLSNLFSARRISKIYSGAIESACEVAAKEEEVSPLLLAEFYHWAERLFEPSKTTAMGTFERLAGRLPHAKQLLEMLKVATDSESVLQHAVKLLSDGELSNQDKLLFLDVAVKSLCKSGAADSAARLLDAAEASIDLPLRSYHGLISLYCETARMEVAKPIVEYLTLSKGLELDDEVLNSLIGGYSRYSSLQDRASSVEAAVSCYKQLVDKGGKLKHSSAVAFLHTLRAGKDHRLIENVVKNLQPPAMSPPVLKIVLKYHSDTGRFAAAKKVMQAILPFGPRHETSIAPFVRCALRDGAVNTALEAIEEVASHWLPAGPLVEPLFNYYLRNKLLPQAEALLLRLTGEWKGTLSSAALQRAIPIFKSLGAAPASVQIGRAHV